MTFTLRRRQAGQELVEFAVVLSLLMLIVFGVLDLGRLFHRAIVVANAARAGARYGMMFPDDVAGIQSAALQEAEDSGTDLTDAAVTLIERECPDFDGCVEGHPIRVKITHQFRLFLTFVFPSGSITLVRSAEMLIP